MYSIQSLVDRRPLIELGNIDARRSISGWRATTHQAARNLSHLIVGLGNAALLLLAAEATAHAAGEQQQVQQGVVVTAEDAAAGRVGQQQQQDQGVGEQVATAGGAAEDAAASAAAVRAGQEEDGQDAVHAGATEDASGHGDDHKECENGFHLWACVWCVCV